MGGDARPKLGAGDGSPPVGPVHEHRRVHDPGLGFLLDEVHVRPFGKKNKHDLAPIVAPIVAIMTPIFFVRTGMMVDLEGVSVDPLLLAGALTVVAIRLHERRYPPGATAQPPAWLHRVMGLVYPGTLGLDEGIITG